ncbi:MAG: hypothetical protein ACD_75C01906G0002, partial [uncultured bacterium]
HYALLVAMDLHNGNRAANTVGS